MEDKANMMIIKRSSRGGGCPTRLQKHAPASLDTDKVLVDRPSNPFGEASRAIPLLSPLVLSPQPTYADITIQVGTSEKNESAACASSSTPSPTTGWEHPAIISFPEPSSTLCSFFQKQCVFLNHPRWNKFDHLTVINKNVLCCGVGVSKGGRVTPAVHFPVLRL